MKILKNFLFVFVTHFTFAQNANVTINIGAVVGSDSTMQPILGVISGPDANYNSTNSNLTQQLKNIGVKSIRNNDYYDDRLDMDLMFNCGGTTYPSWESCSPTNSNNYNFTASDAQFQSYVNGGFEPFLRLGSEYPPTSGLYVKSFIGPQNSIQETNWINAADTIAKHYVNFPGGNGGLNYLNVWTEWPNEFSFWTRPNSEFYPFFTNAVRQLKTSHPNKKIGGPGMLSSFMNKGLPSNQNEPYQLLKYMYQNNVKPDFLSFHVFSSNPMNYYNASKQFNDMIKATGSFAAAPWVGTGFFEQTELIIDAWGNTNNPTNEFGASNGTFSAIEMDKYLAKTEGATAFLAAWSILQRANVAGGFYYRAGDLPNTSPTSLANAASLGLFYGDGSYKRVAYAFKMVANLFENYNKILDAPLLNITNQSDTLWCLAGKSIDNKKAVLISNTSNKDVDINLTMNGLVPNSLDYSSVESFTLNNQSDGTVPVSWNPLIPNTIKAKTSALIVFTPLNVTTHNSTLKSVSQFTVFPNPNEGNFTIQWYQDKTENVEIDLYDISGKKICSLLKGSKESGINNLQININDYPKGMYFIQIRLKNQRLSEKVILF